MDMMKTLTQLAAAFGPSGCEEEAAALIEKLAEIGRASCRERV